MAPFEKREEFNAEELRVGGLSGDSCPLEGFFGDGDDDRMSERG